MFSEVNKFELPKHKGSYEKWPSKTKLFYNKKYTRTKIPGYIIEKQFQIGEYFFIITSYDCDLEEGNEYILLNNKYKVIDRETLGHWFSTYFLDGHKIINDHEIILKYMGDLYIKVTLNPEINGLSKRKIVYETCNGYT